MLCVALVSVLHDQSVYPHQVISNLVFVPLKFTHPLLAVMICNCVLYVL